MKTLEFMYVYFDKLGNIKAISPMMNMYKESDFFVTMFPLEEVEAFLSGKKNPSDYLIERKELPLSTDHKLVRKKRLDANYIRKLDSYITEVSTTEPLESASIVIKNSIKDRTITLSLGSSFETILREGTSEEIGSLESLINFPNIFLYFTAEHDPYFLKYTMPFQPKMLLGNNRITEKYQVDLSNSSVYTRKVINGFRYIIV